MIIKNNVPACYIFLEINRKKSAQKSDLTLVFFKQTVYSAMKFYKSHQNNIKNAFILMQNLVQALIFSFEGWILSHGTSQSL